MYECTNVREEPSGMTYISGDSYEMSACVLAIIVMDLSLINRHSTRGQLYRVQCRREKRADEQFHRE